MQKRHGFTLVELLVVIAIISILAAMLLPTLEQALLQSRRMVSMNNMRQIATGLIQYTDDHNGKFMPGATNYWYYYIGGLGGGIPGYAIPESAYDYDFVHATAHPQLKTTPWLRTSVRSPYTYFPGGLKGSPARISQAGRNPFMLSEVAGLMHQTYAGRWWGVWLDGYMGRQKYENDPQLPLFISMQQTDIAGGHGARYDTSVRWFQRDDLLCANYGVNRAFYLPKQP